MIYWILFATEILISVLTWDRYDRDDVNTNEESKWLVLLSNRANFEQMVI